MIPNHLSQKTIVGKWVELFFWIATLMHVIYRMRSLLIFGTTSIVHDNIYWCYPVFHFFAENIIHGHLPLWNPYSHGGEPIYPLLGQLRLYEPLTLITIFVGQLFTKNLLLLFHWNRLLLTLQMQIGMYLVLRGFTKNLWVRLSLIPILLMSSVALGSFHQDAILSYFLWTPYVIYFLLKIFFRKNYRWHNFFFLAACVGINSQSYFFAGIWNLLFWFFIGLFLFYRRDLARFFHTPGSILKLLLILISALTMMSINGVLLWDQKGYIHPPRMLPLPEEEVRFAGGPMQYEGGIKNIVPGILMSYDLNRKTGSAGNIWNFIQILSPQGNGHTHRSEHKWGAPTESYIYFGILPWVVILTGLFLSKQKQKKLWGFLLVTNVLIFLGNRGFLQPLLYFIYPPLWFMRHLHCLVLFLEFTLLYFYVLGADYLLSFATERWSFDKKSFGYLNAASLILGVFGIVKFADPKSEYSIFVLILVPCVILLCQRFSRHVLFIFFFLIHMLLCTIGTTHPALLLFHYGWAIGIPVLLFFFTTRWNASKETLIPIACLLIIFLDVDHSLATSTLYKGYPDLVKALGVNTTLKNIKPPGPRQIYPPHLANVKMAQDIRYLSLVYQQPSVFSPPHGIPDGIPLPDNFADALESKRWISFLLSRPYFSLVHSNIFAKVQEQMFAVNRELIQWKRGGVVIEDSNANEYLESLGEQDALAVMAEHVLIHPLSVPTNRNLIPPLDSSVLPLDNHDISLSGFSYEYQQYAHNQYSMKLTSQMAGLLYIADGFDHWWRATLNGSPVSIYRANINFKALVLPAGESELTLTYDPTLFKWAVLLFYGAFSFNVFLGFLLGGFSFAGIEKR